ncbi:hypothetical protein JCM30566_13530 [Marinitoga arctica]
MIKVCKNNKGIEEFIEYLKKKNIEYSIENCLDECKICHSKLFFKKNEDTIIADSTEELIDKI